LTKTRRYDPLEENRKSDGPVRGGTGSRQCDDEWFPSRLPPVNVNYLNRSCIWRPAVGSPLPALPVRERIQELSGFQGPHGITDKPLHR